MIETSHAAQEEGRLARAVLEKRRADFALFLHTALGELTCRGRVLCTLALVRFVTAEALILRGTNILASAARPLHQHLLQHPDFRAGCQVGGLLRRPLVACAVQLLCAAGPDAATVSNLVTYLSIYGASLARTDRLIARRALPLFTEAGHGPARLDFAFSVAALDKAASSAIVSQTSAFAHLVAPQLASPDASNQLNLYAAARAFPLCWCPCTSSESEEAPSTEDAPCEGGTTNCGEERSLVEAEHWVTVGESSDRLAHLSWAGEENEAWVEAEAGGMHTEGFNDTEGVGTAIWDPTCVTQNSDSPAKAKPWGGGGGQFVIRHKGASSLNDSLETSTLP